MREPGVPTVLGVDDEPAVGGLAIEVRWVAGDATDGEPDGVGGRAEVDEIARPGAGGPWATRRSEES